MGANLVRKRRKIMNALKGNLNNQSLNGLFLHLKDVSLLEFLEEEQPLQMAVVKVDEILLRFQKVT